jgi:large subunit ribosomal protein L24
MASKLKKGDSIIVIAGKDKGRQSVISRVLHKQGRVIVEGVNLIKKHVRPNPNINEQGGIKELEASIDISNVAIYNPVTKKADRVGFKMVGERNVRIFKSNDEQIDV